MKKDFIKPLLSAALSAAAIYLEKLALPIIVLLFAMCADYVTGMVGAYVTGRLSSRVGIVGIVKKLCYMFAVVCGIIIDYVLASVSSDIGMPGAKICFFGTLVTVWLILNEVVSILENLSEVGVPLPSFLKKITEKLKKTAEQTAEHTK
ncbi:MAG: phage holin family protein [Clostridia bacterium]|jgi:toxin secretion/phage lysis holin|nr:phage holin family protein [Clostridia bacterium]